MLVKLDWKYHGMGVKTAVIARKIVDQRIVADIRVHHWHPLLVIPEINEYRGSIHLHSFRMDGLILKGSTKNIPIKYTALWSPVTAIGPDIWNCWRYNNGNPEWVSSGYIERGNDENLVAGDLWSMDADTYHMYSGNALTLVRRWHTFGDNDVLTCQGHDQDCSPPINGRSVDEPNFVVSKIWANVRSNQDLFSVDMSWFKDYRNFMIVGVT